MIFPCCLYDNEKNRKIAINLVNNEKNVTGRIYRLVSINGKLEVRTEKELELTKHVVEDLIIVK